MSKCFDYKHNNQNSYACVECIHGEMYEKKIITQADKIRSMGDEELAEFLSETHDEEIGKFLGDIATCDNNIKSIFEWLQSEVEE